MTNTRKTYLNDCVYNGHIRKWNKETISVFIAPCNEPQYIEMVKTAYQLWLAETNNYLKVEYVKDLYESDINVSWIELTNENLGNCQFDYDNNGQFIGAEVSVPLPNYDINSQFNDNEVFYTILKLTGYSLGLPSSPYEGDITHETHQYGV